MLTIQHAKRRRRQLTQAKIGLAIAGGGPLGAIYELGALHALDESIEGLRLHRLAVYVGVSAGSFVAASLANGLNTAQMVRIFTGSANSEISFEPKDFLRPAYREYLDRAIPVGLFSNQRIQQFLERTFTGDGRSDDFRELACKLLIVAVDLDSGTAVRFGSNGNDGVPISTAVQASAAQGLGRKPRGRGITDGIVADIPGGDPVADQGQPG